MTPYHFTEKHFDALQYIIHHNSITLQNGIIAEMYY